MKNDPHLLEAEVPIVAGQNYLAKCGKEIPRAQPVMMWDAIELGVPAKLLQIRCCAKCWQKFQNEAPDPWKRERYLYGIISAMSDEEIEAA